MELIYHDVWGGQSVMTPTLSSYLYNKMVEAHLHFLFKHISLQLLLAFRHHSNTTCRFTSSIWPMIISWCKPRASSYRRIVRFTYFWFIHRDNPSCPSCICNSDWRVLEIWHLPVAQKVPQLNPLEDTFFCFNESNVVYYPSPIDLCE